MMSISTTFRPAMVLFTGFTLLTGLIYPLVVTGIGQALFPQAANGSLVSDDGRIVGSALIGQSFTRPDYFWSRPSATGSEPYNAGASSGSNLGPNHADLRKVVAERVATLRAADPSNTRPIPVDLVTASASGLDPHISLAAAEYQAGRVARARETGEQEVLALVRSQSSQTVWGEPRVNVLRLNRVLDQHFAVVGAPSSPLNRS